MKRSSLSALAALLLVGGCSSGGSDPYASGKDGGGGSAAPGSGGVTGIGVGGSAGTDGAVGGGGSGGAAGGMATKPTRMIVLGDSIVACSNIGGPMGADCSIKKLYDYVKATYAPELTYENDAMGGAVTDDVPGKQLGGVTTGAGHALVVVYIGGNDLAKYLFSTDMGAMSGLATDMPKVLADWDQVFATFNDQAKFPDGYTMIMNNQYNPFDDCTAPPYNISAEKNQLLVMFNTALAGVAQKNNATLTDQYTPFLGHGHHYMVMTCPHYIAGAAGWMDDLIHPNAAGHTDLFEQWKKVVDQLYAP